MSAAPSRGYAGAAGEYAVASELSRRGWLASVTLANSPEVDVLAWHGETRELVAIQVKTASPGRKAFQLKTEHEEAIDGQHQWFAFVRLHPDPLERPTFHLVPRNVVAAILYGVRADAERRGKKVGSWRNFLTEWVPSHEEAWDALEAPAGRARRSVRTDVAAFVVSYGRPEDRLAVPAPSSGMRAEFWDNNGPRLQGTVDLIDGVATAREENLHRFLAETNVIEPDTLELLTPEMGVRYLRGLESNFSRGMYSHVRLIE